MTTIHQLISTLAPNDAVGRHALEVRTALREAGITSEIFARQRFGALATVGCDVEAFDSQGTGADLILLQDAYTSEAATWALSRPEPIAVNYHNITPASFLDPWDAQAAADLRRARVHLAALARRAVLGIAVSSYNAQELTRLHFSRVVVADLLLDLDDRLHAPDPATERHLGQSAGGARWLFVGRLAPHKCQHDVLAAFAVYRSRYDAAAELVLVGGEGVPAYADALYALAEDLGLAEAVVFTGPVTDAELAAYYGAADLFVCASQHEGYCVPLLEAMRHRVPVLARGETAVPDTAGDGALLFTDPSPGHVAALAAEVLEDQGLVQTLTDRGRAVVSRYSLASAKAAYVDVLLAASAR